MDESTVETPARDSGLQIPKAALGFGLICGWAELSVMIARKAVDPSISMAALRTNRHWLWMIPLSGVVLLGVVGLFLAVIARLRPSVIRAIAYRLLVAVAVASPLLAIERVYLWASLTLACGFGLRFGPLIERLALGHRRFIRAALSALGIGLVALIGVESYRVTAVESRSRAGRPPAASASPNLLFLVMDNVRADALSLYGNSRPTTPNLERLSRGGVRFNQARSTAPWTLPSHASMFTGRWSHELKFGWDLPLDASEPTLAEFLGAQGYATAGFVGNTYYGNALYGLARGFDRYDDCYENKTISPFEVVRSSGLGKRVLQVFGVPIDVERGGTSVRKTAEMINRDVVEWLGEKPADRPFFVFVNYFDAHGPFVPPEGPDPRFGLAALPKAERAAIIRRYKRVSTRTNTPADGPPEDVLRDATSLFRDSYESCIAYLDRQIGDLFDALEEKGLLENTMIVVTSDHGESFREHGFFGHGLSLYRQEVHVPLLVIPPVSKPGIRVVDQAVSLRDLPATSVGLLGLGDRSPFPGQRLDAFWSRDKYGGDPSPVLMEVAHQSRLAPTAILPASVGSVEAVLGEGKVFIRNRNGREELYDLIADPHDLTNQIDFAPLQPTVQKLRDRLERLRSAGDFGIPASRGTIAENHGGRSTARRSAAPMRAILR